MDKEAFKDQRIDWLLDRIDVVESELDDDENEKADYGEPPTGNRLAATTVVLAEQIAHLEWEIRQLREQLALPPVRRAIPLGPG